VEARSHKTKRTVKTAVEGGATDNRLIIATSKDKTAKAMEKREICSRKLRGNVPRTHNRNLLITRVPGAGFFGFLLYMRAESRPLNELGPGFNRFEWVRKRRESATTVRVDASGYGWARVAGIRFTTRTRLRER